MTLNNKINNGGRESITETIGIVHSALAKADERDDEWGNEVKYRLTPF